MDERWLTIRDERLYVHPDRALVWPERQAVFISDVHVGKSQHFRDHGAAVPEDLEDTVARLDRLAEGTEARHLYILGDLVHTSYAITPEIEAALSGWLEKTDARVTVVLGNHDRGMGATFRRWGMRVSTAPIVLEPFELAHEPGPSEYFRIAGHVHPTCILRAGADRIRLPCLWVGDHSALLPAFSKFTAGLEQRRDNARIFVFFDGEVRRV